MSLDIPFHLESISKGAANIGTNHLVAILAAARNIFYHLAMEHVLILFTIQFRSASNMLTTWQLLKIFVLLNGYVLEYSLEKNVYSISKKIVVVWAKIEAFALLWVMDGDKGYINEEDSNKTKRWAFVFYRYDSLRDKDSPSRYITLHNCTLNDYYY